MLLSKPDMKNGIVRIRTNMDKTDWSVVEKTANYIVDTYEGWVIAGSYRDEGFITLKFNLNFIDLADVNSIFHEAKEGVE